MHNLSSQIRKLLNALVGVLLVLGIEAAQAVMAEGQETFTNASLQDVCLCQ